ncbi:MAG: hypothetical protein IPJ98_09785 [Bryobacterales bacterium]|nr:hypothetical protein [Bryobacterales bacterium]
MRMLTTAVAVLMTAAALCAQSRAPEIESIQRGEMKADLFFLASDEMRGRLTNTPEYRLAAEWIVSRFQRLGLKPAGDNGEYFQEFELVSGRLGEGNRMVVGDGASRRTARLLEEFYPVLHSANGEVKGGGGAGWFRNTRSETGLGRLSRPGREGQAGDGVRRRPAGGQRAERV